MLPCTTWSCFYFSVMMLVLILEVLISQLVLFFEIEWDNPNFPAPCYVTPIANRDDYN